MIRRFLIVMLAMLVWTVQVADAGVDHSDQLAGDVEIVLVVGESESDSGIEQSLVCASGCVCHVFHHAFLDTPAAVTSLAVNHVAFDVGESAFAPFLSSPPTRPPLV